MPHLSGVTHENPTISKKVNYFCNYFAQANRHLGQLPRFMLSSPSYVIGSVLYQLKTNLPNSKPYIGNLLKNLSEDDLEIIEHVCPDEQKTKLLADLVAAAKSNSLSLKKGSDDLISSLEATSEALKKSELKYLVECLASNLGCPHKLKTHKKLLEYLAVTLVSIYRLNGFGKKQTRKNFDAIFSRSIHQFPFPSHIYEIENKEERMARKEEYLANRKFTDHFTAIDDSVNRKVYTPYVIVLLHNVKIEPGALLDLEFNGVRVVGPANNTVIKIKEALLKEDPEDTFFNHEDYAVCMFQIEVKTNVGDQREYIYAKAQTLVNYLNARLGSSRITVNRNKYLETLNFETFGSGWSSDSPYATIRKGRIPFLQDNASSYLKEVLPSLKHTLLYTENLFWEGKNENDLVKLWQYLENSTPTDEKGSRHVCKTVRNILLYRKSHLVDSIYSEDLINVLSSMSPYDRDEFPDDIVQLLRKRDLDIDIFEVTKHSKDPFIRSLGQHWRVDRKRAADAAFADHWNDILNEARAYRNMVLHDGNFHTPLETRLNVCLPYVTTKYRFQCIDLVMKAQRRKNYAKLIMFKVDKKDL